MEKNNNKNSSKINFPIESSLRDHSNQNHNLLDKIDTIQYKGLRIPRLFVPHPFSVDSPKTSTESKDTKLLKLPKIIKNENEIYIPIKEKNIINFNEGNKLKYYPKINNNIDFINNVEDKNLFNIFLKNDKNYNLIQPQNFVNISNSRLENKNIINNNLEKINSKEKIQNKINIINNNIYNINFPNLYNFNNPFFDLNAQNKLILKPLEKQDNIGKDNFTITFMDNSNANNQKTPKSLFVVNEMLNKDNIKE